MAYALYASVATLIHGMVTSYPWKMLMTSFTSGSIVAGDNTLSR